MGQELRTLLRQAIKERGYSMRFVSTQLIPPRDPSWLGKALRGKRRLYLEDITRILAVISLPREQFWRRHFATVSDQQLPHLVDLEPALLLSRVAGDISPQAPRALAEAFATDLPRLRSDPQQELPASLRRIDDLRLSQPQAALMDALVALQGALGRLRHSGQREGQIAHVIALLGVAASALRATGKSSEAAATLARAFSLLDQATDGPLFADLLYRSGVILADLGYPATGVSFLERAVIRFSLLEHTRDEIKSLLALGIQSFYLGHERIARPALERVLSCPAATTVELAIAITNLALVLERSGKQDDALALLARFEGALAAAAPKIAVGARWIKARALVGVHRLAEAHALYGALAGDVIEHGDPLDPLIFFCEHLALLLRLKRFREARAIAQELAAYREQTPLAPGAEELLEVLLQDLQAGTSTAGAWSEAALGLSRTRLP